MSRFAFGPCVLDTARRELLRDGRPVAVSRRAFDCLSHLVQHRGRDVGRDELVAVVFRRPDVSDVQLGQIVLLARRAVGDDGGAQRFIRTVPRRGFRWVAETRVPETAVAPAAASAPRPEPAPAAPAPAAATRRPRLAPVLLVAGAVLVAGWVATLAWNPPARRHPVAAPRPVSGPAAAADLVLVLVLPARLDAGEEARWMRLGLMDYLADRLRRAGLAVAPSETGVRVSERTDAAARNAAAAGNLDSAALLRRSGAGLLLESRVRPTRGGWRVDLAAAAADGVVQRARGDGPGPIPAARTAADRLLAALGRAPPGGADESPPELEERLLRAQAATLANRLDTAREILRAAPELQRQAPQLRYRLAQVDFHAGRYVHALTELDRLLALPGLDGPLRTRLHNARGANLIRLNRHREARREFDRAIALLETSPDPPELGKALNGRGITRLVLADFEGAAADLGRSRILLVNAGDVVGAARADANLGHLERRRDRPHQALEHFLRAAAEFESLGSVNDLMSMRSMVVDGHLGLLQNRLAERASAHAVALRPRLADVVQLAMVDLDRARALLRVGRLGEAARLLAAPAPDSRPDDSLGDLAKLLQVELAMQAGRHAAATRLADAARRERPAEGPSVQDWLALRREQAALAAELPSLPDAGDGPAADSVAGWLTRAVRLRRQGEAAGAEAAYREALALADRGGVPRDLVEVAMDQVPWAIERGRLDEALALAGRVAPWAQQDFDAAVLQLHVQHALGDPHAWRSALEHALALAGERRIPPQLLSPPPGPRAQGIDPQGISPGVTK
ncbi:winged helix-turn-helix domain-containing protein [Luteimonas sp. RD2P54]|uniref:Winged helix-turn-helix domain-containing protein n=1 Tax=Luteimonas endophytica TaxID=3042023 RepID=A0ABT6JE62_9GAMM|nr:winged helix-turn-helix domain-containing protein [Luteimonas endophytica]MDH5824488.1 winged helix-turn-helix domain-containing protein [Luteimonas endophytica]